MSQFAISILDFFMPRECVSCNEKLTPSENSVCEKCFAKIKTADSDFLQSEFNRKFADEKIVKNFLSLFIFDEDSPIRDLLHGLKYEKKFRLGSFLGKILAANFDEEIKKWKVDYIIPVPLHKLKKAERGFNQSFYISKTLAKSINIKVRADIIKRIRFTETQTKLNAEERKENMKDAFVIKNKKNIEGKNIILLDDVITTGSTISECARVLKENGAENIYAVSVGIAN